MYISPGNKVNLHQVDKEINTNSFEKNTNTIFYLEKSLSNS